ncbi:MAG TPA: YggS family pyridoxal phosphate-dependent enzyme, partial [Polyangia bacterium]
MSEGADAKARATEIARNLDEVRRRVGEAARAAGRTTESVRLIAVSKTKPLSDIMAAVALGQLDFGENYAQELRDKLADAGDVVPLQGGRPRFHFIGPLQSNKAKYLAGKVAMIHTCDSIALLDELERRTASAGAGQDCLVQVNVAREPQKRGIAPDELDALLDQFADRPHLRCVGLMVIPPFDDDGEASRPHFAALRGLRDEAARKPRARVDLTELSMGMSHDLEVAISEGATMVR